MPHAPAATTSVATDASPAKPPRESCANPAVGCSGRYSPDPTRSPTDGPSSPSPTSPAGSPKEPPPAALDQAGSAEKALEPAWQKKTNQEFAASIIGFIRQQAHLGSATGVLRRYAVAGLGLFRQIGIDWLDKFDRLDKLGAGDGSDTSNRLKAGKSWVGCLVGRVHGFSLYVYFYR